MLNHAEPICLKIPTSRMPNVELDVVAVTVGTFTESLPSVARNKCRAFQRVLGRKKADSPGHGGIYEKVRAMDAYLLRH